MARPIKSGLDYFPLDIDIDDEDKICLIVGELGELAFGRLIKLLAVIYKEGYYKRWDEETELLFATRKNIPLNQVKTLVNTALNRGFLAVNLYKTYGILTSTGIQKRYITACKERKRIIIEEKLLLVDLEDFTDKIKSKITLINSGITPIKPEITPVIPESIPKAKQRKVKQSSNGDNPGKTEGNPNGGSPAPAFSLPALREHLTFHPAFDLELDDTRLQQVLSRMQEKECADPDFVDFVLEKMVIRSRDHPIGNPAGFFLTAVLEWDDWIQEWHQVRTQRILMHQPSPGCPVCGDPLLTDARLDRGERFCRSCEKVFRRNGSGEWIEAEESPFRKDDGARISRPWEPAGRRAE